MKILILILFLFISCNNVQDERDKLLPEIKNRIACDIFLSKMTQRIKEKMRCENYFLKDLDAVMPINCENKVDGLDRICRYMLNEFRVDIYRWNCKRIQPLNESDKNEICNTFVKAE